MRPLLAIVAGLLVTALVAAGVTLAVLRTQSRTNQQQVNLQTGVTITENSAIVAAASKARPAVVSIVTQHAPAIVRGSGYFATSDGFIVTNIRVVAGANGMTVLIPSDSPAYVSSMHRVSTVNDPLNLGHTLQFSDTIQTNAVIEDGSSGGPLLNVGSQVIGIAVGSSSSRTGFGLNAADVQDDVQQILQTGQVTVASIGAQTVDITPEMATLNSLPEGSQIVTADKGSPAASAGLQPGDIITQIDDVRLDAAHPLALLLRSRFHADQRVTVTYSRGATSTQAQLKLIGQHPTC